MVVDFAVYSNHINVLRHIKIFKKKNSSIFCVVDGCEYIDILKYEQTKDLLKLKIQIQD